MPSFSLVPVEEAHLPELGRICFEAFSGLQDRHGVPRDFDTAEDGQMVVGLLARRPDAVGVAAVEPTGNGRPRVVGSNFIQFCDPVAGVGPITVDPTVQSKGVGRALMQHVIDAARERDRHDVRLYQEAINSASLSLYTSLGFSWVDSAALMSPPKPVDTKASPDDSVRAMTAADLPAVAELSEASYGANRADDARRLLEIGLPSFVRESRGKVVGYLFPGLLGHAAAKTNDDMLAMLTAMGQQVEGPMAKFICPLSEVALFRSLLGRRARVLKMLNYMALGDTYRRPPGPWLPSILC